MEIIKHDAGDRLEVRVTGRLDAYWADHLTAALDDAVRGGAHHILLNMADVAYMSSVGIRVLLRFYKQLQRINGSFAVSNPSDAVQSVLELTGLEVLLVTTVPVAAAAAPRAVRRFERDGVAFEVFVGVLNHDDDGSRAAASSHKTAAPSSSQPPPLASGSAPSAAASPTANRASASSSPPPASRRTCRRTAPTCPTHWYRRARWSRS